ncbi:flagellar hook capping FlgD N-terminal domain-containing protein [Thalassovita taeanensis]|uniref:Basal-body rod modification protein FlgD n=1 Tax=Thalassovita taeanensis TaxID=657014 RepID=A0A1H9I9G9_9RHOB|nr:flagellar hook capping FlgD N-terminal domain-containing protein [Thalassovita taeanensis]SEQ71209.1 flagellar basal-body rod modification protein FlgD [Thalassovita taeanensis]
MTTIAPTPAATNAASPNGSAAENTTVLSSDFETFLKMLTAQMQNQDPLNPMDSSEYAMQLATFSSVEQQVLTNDLLSSLIYMSGQSGMTQLAEWVGLEGRTAGAIPFNGEPVEVFATPPAIADSAQLVVYDEAGNEVDRTAFDPDSSSANWWGTDSNGTPFPTGLYSFQVESYANGKLSDTSDGETWAPVIEARNDSGVTQLVLAGGTEIYADAISAVRAPQ